MYELKLKIDQKKLLAYNLRIECKNKDHVDLRLKFLKSEITEKQFLFTLKKRDKAIEKNIAINQLFEMCANSLVDLINSFILHPAYDFFSHVENLRKYVNEQFENIHSRFRNLTYFVDENWIDIKRID